MAAKPEDQPTAGDQEKDEVILESSDAVRFTVEREVAFQSKMIKSAYAECIDDKEVMPLPNVHSTILQRVIEYLKYHKDNPAEEISKPLKSNSLGDVVCDYDYRFTDVEQQTLFELILAANYLDIKSLLDLTCAKVATMIKGKSVEEIRKEFNIVNDFTPQEEAQVREENKWCEGASTH